MAEDDSVPITFNGRFVAIARPERVHVLVSDLRPDELALVTAMSWYARAVLLGDAPAPYTDDAAARVAAYYLAHVR